MLALGATKPAIAQEGERPKELSQEGASEEAPPSKETEAPQNAAATSSTPSSNQKKAEVITVTGSRLKRIDQELASPVIVIDREKIKESGLISVGELLVESSIASGGDFQRADWGGNEGGSIVGIKGLSPSETLYLLNGRPMPRKPVNNFWHPDKNITSDLSMIPTAAIDRIEILTDGASALYGSEAIGGVVNIITLQNFNQTKVNATYRIPEIGKGESNQFSIVSGSSTDDSNFLISFEQSQSKFWRARDLDTVKLDLSQSHNLRPVTDPGSFMDANGIWFPNQNCEAMGNTIVDMAEQGRRCATNNTNENTLGPKVLQQSIYATFDKKLLENLSLMGNFLATTHRSEVRGTFPEAIISVPSAIWENHRTELEAANPGISLPADGSDIEYSYGAAELGGDWNEQVSNEFAYTLGLNGEIFGDYNWSVTRYEGTHRGDWNFHNNYLVDCVDVLMAGGFPGQSFDPFAPAGQRQTGEGFSYCKHDLRFKKFFKETKVDALISGSALLGGYTLDFAFGASTSRYDLSAGIDPASKRSTWGFIASRGVEGSRSNDAVYFETQMKPLSNVNVNLAGRYDKFSDVESTFNPKLAVSYMPLKSVKLRASTGTAFRAPYVAATQSSNNTPNSVSFADQRKCRGEGLQTFCDNPYAIDVIAGAPNRLKPETSKFYNFGVIFEPQDNLDVALDYWRIDTEDIVSDLSGDIPLIADAEYRGSNLEGKGIIIKRDGDVIAGELPKVTSITVPWVNISSRHASGLNARVNWKYGKFGLTNSYNHLYHLKSERIPGLQSYEAIGTPQNPRFPALRWRNTLETRYSIKPATIGLDMRSLAGFKVNEGEREVFGKDEQKSYSEFDTHVALNFDRINWILGVKNVLDAYPRDKDAEFRAEVYSSYINVVGRRYFSSVSYTF